MFGIGYFVTYLECNYRKEINEIIDFKNHGLENPCNKVNVQQKDSYLPWINWNGAKMQDCTDYMKKQAKIDIKMCLPLDVLIEFTSEIYSKIFEKIFSSTFSTFHKITESFGWMGTLITAPIFALVIYVFGSLILGSTIQSSFRYGFGNILGMNQPRQTENRTSNSETNDEVTVRLARVLETLVNQNQKNVETKRINETENRIEDLNKQECTTTKDTGDGSDEFEYVEINDNDVPKLPIGDVLIEETVDTKIDQPKKSENVEPLAETIVEPK